MLVFRDGRRTLQGEILCQGLAHAIRVLRTEGRCIDPPAEDKLIDALLRAGELECALADAAWPEAGRMTELTDALASLLVTSHSDYRYSELLEFISAVPVPPTLRISSPEGFAYYALHPLHFADSVCNLLLRSDRAAVIGIRSIGTTLSAVVVAALRKRGVIAERVTVRPCGHPFDRHTEFSVDANRWIARQRELSAEFVVVDEGPGLSGSSFLSVADALTAKSVEPSRVVFLCSSEPDVNRLCASDAAVRWAKFRTYTATGRTVPGDALTDIGGGQWRNHFYNHASLWPASWIQMERTKFLSRDQRSLVKFEGFGRYGREVYRRSCVLGENGFAPVPCGFDNGYVSYPVEKARPASAQDISQKVVDQLAQYCAFRRREFQVNVPASQSEPGLAGMLRWNVQEEFGHDLTKRDLSQIPDEMEISHPVLVDGRMQPHEWLLMPNRLLKVDGASHGDDHFFPGPTDIAWDLAGTIVEWRMDSRTIDYFTDRYRLLSGDDPEERLPLFINAYTAFRLGYCKMAAESMSGSEEQGRLYQEYQRYRALLAMWLPNLSVAS